MNDLISIGGNNMYISSKNEQSYESQEKDTNGNNVTTRVSIAEVLNGFVINKTKSWKEPIAGKEGEYDYKEENETYISKDDPLTKKMKKKKFRIL